MKAADTTEAKPGDALADELLPCPFCDVRLERIESWAQAFKPARLFHEYHHERGGTCFIRERIVWSGEAGSKAEADYIAKWNTRAALRTPAPPPTGDVAALVDLDVIGEIADDLDQLGHHWRANRIREAATALISHSAREKGLREAAIDLALKAGVLNVALDGSGARYAGKRQAVVDAMRRLTAVLETMP